jgi:hypothetical protein
MRTGASSYLRALPFRKHSATPNRRGIARVSNRVAQPQLRDAALLCALCVTSVHSVTRSGWDDRISDDQRGLAVKKFCSSIRPRISQINTDRILDPPAAHAAGHVLSCRRPELNRPRASSLPTFGARASALPTVLGGRHGGRPSSGSTRMGPRSSRRSRSGLRSARLAL